MYYFYNSFIINCKKKKYEYLQMFYNNNYFVISKPDDILLQFNLKYKIECVIYNFCITEEL